MRKVVASEFLTVDGVMEAPNQFTFSVGQSEEQLKFKFDELFAADALLLGRKTYEGFAAAWPSVQGAGAYGERMNTMPKHVFSRTLKTPEWNASFLTGSPAEEIAKLKKQDGQDLLIFGSGALVQSLIAQDLIDEYRLMIFPLVAGSGRRLFPEGSAPKTLKLMDTKSFSSGVVVLIYQKATE